MNDNGKLRVVLATHNAGKIRELADPMADFGIEVVGLSLFPEIGEIEETGTTFEENALIKARAVMEASGLPAIADDSGLCVDWLNGAPGIYSARYGGLDDDKARYTLLLQNMRGATDRAAHFHTSVVCCFPDGKVLQADGDCHGTIAFAPRGEGGFGYDPIFNVPSLRKTFAQLTAEEKNAISHRGNALRAFAAELKHYMEKN